MVRRSAARAASVLIGVGLMVAVGGAAPAFAAGTCASGHICMWEDAGYNGSKYVDYVPGTNAGDKFNIDGWDGDNEISSVINNTDKVAVLYDNDDYTGTKACVGANSRSSDLGVTNGFNDRAESFILKSSCS